jgi:quinol monooxygenase YgiN
MMTAFVQHRVKNYDAWRRVYDSVADLQKAGGVVTESVFRSEGDPHVVLVSHQFSSISAAHDFFASPALLDAMRRAGVEEETVRIEFFEDA